LLLRVSENMHFFLGEEEIGLFDYIIYSRGKRRKRERSFLPESHLYKFTVIGCSGEKKRKPEFSSNLQDG